jgi:predicted RNA binding protein YcfA (HicA-like mRNA interferase family)
LAASINQRTPSPKTIPLGATFNIGKGLLSDYFRENFILVPIASMKGTVAPPKSMAFSIPSKGIRRILTKKGFQKTELGKGSHEVWTHDTRPSVTLPARKEFEGFQVLTNIRDSLGFESLHELREAAKRA